MAGEHFSEDAQTAEVLAPELDALIGETLDGRFRIVERIGQGAMGRVYRAMQMPLNRPVAIKVLDSRHGAGRDESFRARFLVEAALTAKLTHPNTVRVLDYGSTPDGLYYLVMEYLAGESLEAVLERGPLPWWRVLGVGQQLARSLKEAHSLGVVHRDLKPGNVVLLATDDDADHVKVLDFGLVKSFVDGHELEGRAITQQGMLMGSPPYMAPEQGERNRADPRSDVYSLGVVLFEALTGAVPFAGKAPLEIIMKHVHEPVPPVVTPAHLEPIPELMSALVVKCLAKSPMDRFDSMDEVLQAMQEISTPIRTPVAEMPASDPVIPVPLAGARASRAKGTWVLLVGFVAAIAVGVLGTALVMRSSSSAPAAAPKAVAVHEEPRAAAVQPAPVLRVHVETEPPGARVVEGTSVLGVTPLDLERPMSSKTVELSLSKPAYETRVVLRPVSGPTLEVFERLTPLLPRVEPERPKHKVVPKAMPSAQPASKLDEDDDVVVPLMIPVGSELKRPTGLSPAR